MDANGRVTAAVTHELGGDFVHRRIDESEARKLEAIAAKRVENQAPLPGSEAALRCNIEAMQQGKPLYGEMTEDVVLALRRQFELYQKSLATLGPLQSVSFRGVGPQGWDVYEAKFANGVAIWRLTVTPERKVDGLMGQFTPSSEFRNSCVWARPDQTGAQTLSPHRSPQLPRRARN
jgi:hypothetical protein